MRIVLVRHAHAGHKSDWTAPDHLRPLDAAGARHARRLVGLLRDVPVTRLLSSPTRRCVQTLEPLGEELRRPILTIEELGPQAPPDRVLAMLEDPAFEGAVVCTHGEVLRPVLDVLATRQPDQRHFEHRRSLTKGSAWDLTLDHGVLTAHRHLDPTR